MSDRAPSNHALSKRVTVLEQELKALRQEFTRQKTRQTGWRTAVEAFSGDADLLAVFASAMEQREVSRKKARSGRPTARRKPA
jgi:hypothetical protein